MRELYTYVYTLWIQPYLLKEYFGYDLGVSRTFHLLRYLDQL